MSRNLPVASSQETGEGAAVPQRQARADDEMFSPYYFVHQYLRGRYALVVGLGVAMALLLGLGGYLTTPPTYRSEALIRVAYDSPRVDQASGEQGRSLEVFQAFMQSQQAMISSHRVLSRALESKVWQDAGLKVNTKAVDGFASDLKVEQKGEHLRLAYMSSNPQFAAAAVRSVVDAYVDTYKSLDSHTMSELAAALESRRKTLLAQMEKLDQDLRAESAEFGSSNVERFYDMAVQQLTRVESALIDVRIALALTDGRRDGGGMRFTPQQIARFDPTMSRYMADREDLEMRLAQFRLRGYGEEHKQILETKKQLEMVARRIQDYASDFQDTRAAMGPAAAPAAPQPNMLGTPANSATNHLMGRSAEELKADEANLVALNTEVKEKMVTLGKRKLLLEGLRSEQEKSKTELAEVSQKLAMMQLEAGLSGRLSVLSNGEVPPLPFRDRRKYVAGAGVMVGMVLPAAGFIGVGVARRRYRYSADATDELAGDIPLLGILPQLPARLTDPESAADAAQCLHQIRVMLQVKNPTQGPVVYLLTSACPGEGKTSLCVALSLSFAAAGARTLVVDADMIGQRLTRGYHLEDKPGFREAMQPGAKEACFYASGVERLSVLPAGASDGRDACAVSSKLVKKLVNSVRDEFDVVLIDSGPILGSLEALVVSQHADGVILTISREQQKPLVDRAIRQLRSVRAKIAGMVFNKAEAADFRRSVGASSLRSIPRNPESGALVKAGVTNTSGFGSLVDSVQTYMPTANAT